MTARAPVRNLGLSAAACAVFVAGMVGVTFAAVPLYRVFCQATGYGGTTQKAETAPAATLDRVVTVRFDANVGNGLGWSFRPLVREVKVRLGEVGRVSFFAENRMNRVSTGAAAFNVAPGEVGVYFNKIACFCFNEQTLAAGERVEMPVTFFVDPAFADDPDLGGTDTITLSYTFYPSTVPARPVAAAVGAKAADAL
ncbi:MAG: cytochrome c oxidase assembly protein [Bauldia sp.]|nr:cytochrome c oxidase assembly protein [Bauldia sp.]